MKGNTRPATATKLQPQRAPGEAALEAVERVLKAASPDALPGFVGALERLKTLALARLLEGDGRRPSEERRADPSQLLTVPEVAEKMRCSQWNVYDYIRRGRLPRVMVGRLLRVRAGDLESFLDERGGRAY